MKYVFGGTSPSRNNHLCEERQAIYQRAENQLSVLYNIKTNTIHETVKFRALLVIDMFLIHKSQHKEPGLVVTHTWPVAG